MSRAILRIYRKLPNGDRVIIHEEHVDPIINDDSRPNVSTSCSSCSGKISKMCSDDSGVDPTWSQDTCIAAMAIAYIKSLIGNVQGKIRDSNGNIHDMSNVTYSIDVPSQSTPNITGKTCLSASIKVSGQISPTSDICAYEFAFLLYDKNNNLIASLDVRNTSGSGNGILLKGGNIYMIELEEDITCGTSMALNAPDGTC